MMEESGLEMDVGNARPASLESVNPIELNEHWNEEIALALNSTWCVVDIQMSYLEKKEEISGNELKILKFWMGSCTIRDLEI